MDYDKVLEYINASSWWNEKSDGFTKSINLILVN